MPTLDLSDFRQVRERNMKRVANDDGPERYRKPARLLFKVLSGGSINRYDEVLPILIKFCEGARNYSWDEEKLRKVEDRNAIQDAPSAAIAARKIASYLTRFKRHSKLISM